MIEIFECAMLFVAIAGIVYLVLHLWEEKEHQRQDAELKKALRKRLDWDA